MKQGNKKIRVFIDGHSFDKEVQGTHIFIRELYGTLLKKYDEFELYVGCHQTERIQQHLPFISSKNIIPYKKRLIGLSRHLLDIPAILRRYKFDFAHFQYIAPASIPGCKYIVTLHDVLFNDFSSEFSWFYRFSRNNLFRRSIRQAAIKTTVSHYSRDRIANHYNISPNDINVIPSGVNAAYGNAYSKEEAAAIIKEKYGVENFILYVSRIEPRKNQLLLLKRYLSLALYNQDISLVLIGKDSIPVKELYEILSDLSWDQTQHVHWFRVVDNKDLEAFYRAARLFVYPSKAEGFGVPPLEAALCRAPVLCSSATAMQDFEFFDPYRFDINQTDQLDQKLQEMLTDPPGIKFRENVANKINEQYAWDKTAEKFYSLLKKHMQP